MEIKLNVANMTPKFKYIQIYFGYKPYKTNTHRIPKQALKRSPTKDLLRKKQLNILMLK
jgi:hypothetical protein